MLPTNIKLSTDFFFMAIFFPLLDAGFYFIPGALSVQEQGRWIRESLISFPQPPNRTNHNVEYGPINDLFITAKERQVLVEDKSMLQSGVPSSESRAANGSGFHWKFVDEPEVKSTERGQKSVAASVLLRKLRWSTLGLQFNWSQVRKWFGV